MGLDSLRLTATRLRRNRWAGILAAATVAAAVGVLPTVAHASDPPAATPVRVADHWLDVPAPAGAADASVRVHLQVTSPDDDGRHPVMLVAQTVPQPYWDRWVGDGYAVAHLDLPGYGQSGGCTDFGGPLDLAAMRVAATFVRGPGPDSVEAAGASQLPPAFSDGTVIAVGDESGGSPYALRTPEVQAVVASDAVVDRSGLWAAVGDLASAAAIAAMPERCAATTGELRAQAAAVPASDDFWRPRTYADDTTTDLPPALMIKKTVGADPAAQGQTLRAAAALVEKDARSLVYLTADPAGPGSDATVRGWLRAAVAPVPSDAPGSAGYAIDRGADGAGTPRIDRPTAWPDPTATAQVLEFVSALPVASPAAAALAGARPLADKAAPAGRGPAAAEQRTLILVTDPAVTDLTLSGVVAATVAQACTAADPAVPIGAVLVLLDAQGAMTPVEYGRLPSAAGTAATFGATEITIPAGSRAGLWIAADAPACAVAATPGALSLPIVGGPAALDAAFPGPSSRTDVPSSDVGTAPATSAVETATLPASPTATVTSAPPAPESRTEVPSGTVTPPVPPSTSAPTEAAPPTTAPMTSVSAETPTDGDPGSQADETPTGTTDPVTSGTDGTASGDAAPDPADPATGPTAGPGFGRPPADDLAGLGPELTGADSPAIVVPTLSMSVVDGSPVRLDPIGLTGRDAVTTGMLHPLQVRDPGTAAWNLTGQVSDFRSDRGDILAQNLGWRPSVSVLAGSGAAVVAGPAVAPGDPGLATFQMLCAGSQSAAARVVECGGQLELGVPAAAPAGEYRAVLTLTLI